jgi:hypothetical protein
MPDATYFHSATCEGRGGAHYVLIQAHQTYAGRPKQHRKHLHPYNADQNISYRRAANNGAGSENFSV